MLPKLLGLELQNLVDQLVAVVAQATGHADRAGDFAQLIGGLGL
jgi:hypothetical protein